MSVMHHDVLRVNAAAPESDEVFAIYAERGWVRGPHADTDPDDPTRGIKRVLPPAKAKATATTKKD
jgi:hypothetical protein